MSIVEMREKLHDYIETADEQQLSAIYTFVDSEVSEEGDDGKDYVIDDDFMQVLNERVEKYERGETKTYTAQESIERARQQLKKK